MLPLLKASALPTVRCVLMLDVLPLPLCSVAPAADTLISLQSFHLSLDPSVSPIPLFFFSPAHFIVCIDCCLDLLERLHWKKRVCFLLSNSGNELTFKKNNIF